MQHMHNGNQMNLNMQVCSEAGMQHMGRNMRIQTHQTQVSPSSEFLSPYPAQTPGSHHSQVSNAIFQLFKLVFRSLLRQLTKITLCSTTKTIQWITTC
jgi:hypothetical protein